MCTKFDTKLRIQYTYRLQKSARRGTEQNVNQSFSATLETLVALEKKEMRGKNKHC